MTEIDTDKLRALHTAANRIADNGNHLAIKVSSGCFDYCSGGCDCAEEAKRIKATADSDAVEFHRLISAILAMAEERKAWAEAVTAIMARCEALEDEAANELVKAESEHAQGYWRGQKRTAKSIRRELHDLTRALRSGEREGAHRDA